MKSNVITTMLHLAYLTPQGLILSNKLDATRSKEIWGIRLNNGVIIKLQCEPEDKAITWEQVKKNQSRLIYDKHPCSIPDRHYLQRTDLIKERICFNQTRLALKSVGIMLDDLADGMILCTEPFPYQPLTYINEWINKAPTASIIALIRQGYDRYVPYITYEAWQNSTPTRKRQAIVLPRENHPDLIATGLPLVYYTPQGLKVKYGLDLQCKDNLWGIMGKYGVMYSLELNKLAPWISKKQQISWLDIDMFAQKLAKQPNLNYGFPTTSAIDSFSNIAAEFESTAKILRHHGIKTDSPTKEDSIWTSQDVVLPNSKDGKPDGAIMFSPYYRSTMEKRKDVVQDNCRVALVYQISH